MAGLLMATACGTLAPMPKTPEARSGSFRPNSEGDADVDLLGEAPCRRMNVAGPQYGHTVLPHGGDVGDGLRISGTTLRGEDWRWAPAQRMEVWWDLGNSTVPQAGSVLLAEFDPRRACRFQVETKVPPAQPGTYPINVLVYFEDEVGPFLPVRFRLSG